MEDELERLRAQVRADRKLIRRAVDALAEIDRGPGLGDHNVEVLAALRIRLEGKERASLEDLLSAAGDLGSNKKKKKDLGEVIAEPGKSSDWPTVDDGSKEWPGL